MEFIAKFSSELSGTLMESTLSMFTVRILWNTWTQHAGKIQSFS